MENPTSDYEWCDNIGNEVHVKGDDEPSPNGRLTLAMALAAILGLSLAAWGVIWLLVVLIKSMIEGLGLLP